MKNTLQKICLFSVIVASSFTITACAHSHQAANFYHQAQAAYNQQDYHSAFLSTLAAARLGEPNAAYAVGYLYYNGIGTPRDQSKAITWFNKAARQGQPRAIQALKKLDANAKQQMFNKN